MSTYILRAAGEAEQRVASGKWQQVASGKGVQYGIGLNNFHSYYYMYEYCIICWYRESPILIILLPAAKIRISHLRRSSFQFLIFIIS